VRITKRGASKAEPVVGIYLSASAQTVEVSQPDSYGGPEKRISVPIDDLASIEVSRGRSHHTLAGLLVGFLAGGAILAAAISSSGDLAPIGAFVFPVAGALAGGLVGSGLGSERWEKVWNRPAEP